MPRRWYQTIHIDGVDAVFEDVNRKESKFWNEGKWDNFIKPLLPKERQTFLEIGCNAGLFLKMATDAGFKRVTGVERNRQIMNQAKRFREYNGGQYKLINQRVGVDFELDQVQLSDVVLMSNFHYYLGIPEFARLVDDLKNRCLYCIVVSARAKRRSGNALWNIESVRGYFRDWEELGVIEGLDDESDISPRPHMYGILFRGNLSVMDVNKIYDDWVQAAQSWKHKSYELPRALETFFDQALNGEMIDYEETLLYKYWRKRVTSRSPEACIKKLIYNEALAKDIQENGIKTPIYYVDNVHLRDGLHRLCIARLLGYEHVLGKKI